MIKIVKEGPATFKTTCDRCRSELEYEVEDVDVGGHIRCSKCGQLIKHTPSYYSSYTGDFVRPSTATIT